MTLRWELIYPYFTSEDTEKLNDYSKITQPVSSRARIQASVVWQVSIFLVTGVNSWKDSNVSTAAFVSFLNAQAYFFYVPFFNEKYTEIEFLKLLLMNAYLIVGTTNVFFFH